MLVTALAIVSCILLESTKNENVSSKKVDLYTVLMVEKQ